MTPVNETPLFVEGGAGPLFAIESEPVGEAKGSVVVNAGGWLGTGTNRNAVLVRMARTLAQHGHRVVRFDWRGTGESGGTIARFDLKNPFKDDVGAVISHLESSVGGSIALTGICFGSVSALAAARQHTSVDRLALISVPFPAQVTKADHKTDRLEFDSVIKMAMKPATWSALLRNQSMRQAVVRALKRKVLRQKSRGSSAPSKSSGLDTAAAIDELVARGVQIHLIFGEGDLEYESYRVYTDQASIPEAVTVRVVPGDLSNFGTLEAQQAAIDHVVAALTE